MKVKRFIYIALLIFSCNVFSQNTIVSGEYWLDQDFTGRIPISVTSATNLDYTADIDVGALVDGLHSIHFRFLDDSSRWSSATSTFFVKKTVDGATVTREIVGYEYWFDFDFEGRVRQSTTSLQDFNVTQNIDVSSLQAGLHSVHYRFKDSKGTWSSATSNFFVKKNIQGTAETNEITDYEYWLNFDFENRTQQSVTAVEDYNLNQNIDVGALNTGLHSIHYRFKDANGKWSSATSKFFVKKMDRGSSVVKQVTDYEYWFDQDFAGRVQQSVESTTDFNLTENIDAGGLNKGLHIMHYRFKDSDGVWSSATSKFFVKRANTVEMVDNEIVAYRYWVNDGEIQEVAMAEGAKNAVIADNIDMKHIRKGDNVVYLQFKDKYGNWSSAVSDTVEKIGYPIANFTTGQTLLCDSSIVDFAGTVFDADTIIWTINGVSVGADESLAHKFTEPGSYEVVLTAMDTVLDIDSSQTIMITVDEFLSDIIVIDNSEICDGDSLQIQAAKGYTYAWTGGETSNNVFAKEEKWYVVEVTTENDCKSKDSVYVAVNALPEIELGEDRSHCGTDTIIAGQQFASYLWNGVAGNHQLIVGQSGKYVLAVTNEDGCTNSDSVNVTINEIPVVDLGEDSTINADESIILDAGSGFASYNWSDNSTNETLDISGASYGVGTYNVSVVVESTEGCAGSDTITITIENANSILEQGIGNVSIYPVPSEGDLYIANQSGLNEMKYFVFSVSGAILKQGELNNGTNYVDLNDLSSGYYVVRLKSGEQIWNNRIILE